ncbi:MAG: LytR/AlgR family response regulator transcription factor [Arenicella sp.]
MLNVVIADDEPLARVRLQRFLSKLSEVNEIFIGSDGKEALDLIDQHQPDLVVLDINMPGKTGIEVVQSIQKSQLRPPAIIFTTAYDEFAIEAFKVNAAAYLMKPIEEKQLFDAIGRAGQLNRVQANDLGSADQQSIMLKRSATIESLKVSDIAYFQANEKMVMAGLVSGVETIVNFSLKQLDDKLNPVFLRIHRHTLINTHFLKKIEKNAESGAYIAVLDKIDKPFEVSRRQVSVIKKHFAELYS